MLKFGNTYLNFGGTYLKDWRGNTNLLNLPSGTIRLRYKDNVTPSFSKGTAVQLSQSPNIWDLTYDSCDWNDLLKNHTELIEVLGANTTGITSMASMFFRCISLLYVPLFDTSNVTDMSNAFCACNSITTIPAFDTSKVISFESAFSFCVSLKTIPLLDTSNATKMIRMFDGCSSLTTIPLIDTSNVHNMDGFFISKLIRVR